MERSRQHYHHCHTHSRTILRTDGLLANGIRKRQGKLTGAEIKIKIGEKREGDANQESFHQTPKLYLPYHTSHALTPIRVAWFRICQNLTTSTAGTTQMCKNHKSQANEVGSCRTLGGPPRSRHRTRDTLVKLIPSINYSDLNITLFGWDQNPDLKLDILTKKQTCTHTHMRTHTYTHTHTHTCSYWGCRPAAAETCPGGG